MKFKIRTLEAALETKAPSLNMKSAMNSSQAYRPWRDHWQGRPEYALLEALTLLDKQSTANIPAPVFFTKAERITWSLRSLGLKQEAFQLCRIAHDIVQTFSSSDTDIFRGFLAKSYSLLSRCYDDVDEHAGALTASEKAEAEYELLVQRRDTFRLDHASSLINLSFHCNKAEEKQDAVNKAIKRSYSRKGSLIGVLMRQSSLLHHI